MKPITTIALCLSILSLLLFAACRNEGHLPPAGFDLYSDHAFDAAHRKSPIAILATADW